MKTVQKLTALLLALVLMFTLAACGTSSNRTNATTAAANSGEAATRRTETPTENETQTANPAETGGEAASETSKTEADSCSNILVVYFSRTGEQYTVGVIEEGNTAIVAKMIAEQTGADLFELLPTDDHYPMTYAELTDAAKQEQRDNARPAYAGQAPDLSQYDTIFIGAPVWWGDWPMILYTFFENNAEGLAGKTLIPFSTHEGSGLSGFDRKLAAACPNSTVGEGLAIRGNDCQNDKEGVRQRVTDWLSGLR